MEFKIGDKVIAKPGYRNNLYFEGKNQDLHLPYGRAGYIENKVLTIKDAGTNCYFFEEIEYGIITEALQHYILIKSKKNIKICMKK